MKNIFKHQQNTTGTGGSSSPADQRPETQDILQPPKSMAKKGFFSQNNYRTPI
jgi:hypothetical protein